MRIVHLVAVEHDFEADAQVGTLVEAPAFERVLTQALDVKRVGVGVRAGLGGGI
ncbi:MAG: hypothetical protein HN720_04940, partial [Nitrospinaceae bacterium]|nr:hypothetical protein [Nitrospinaceae bacterium]